MAQTGYTPILIYASGTATNVPLAANLTSSASGAELALNYADGRLYYKNSSGVVTLLASAAGASGDVVGPASATDNALARFDTTTGKLIQNSVGILSDAGVLTGLTGLTSSGNVTLSSLTATRVPYASTGGLLVDSANMTFNGTRLTVADLADSGLTSGRVTYASSGGALVDSANLTFDGTTLALTGLNNTGNTTIGNATADTLTVNALVNSNLLFTDNTYDIGASGATRPRNLFLAGSATLGAGATSAGNITLQNDVNAGQTAKFISSNAFGGSIRFSANGASAGDRSVQLGIVNNGGVFTGYLEVGDNFVTVQGLTVGRGAGAVSTNTAVGASALAANTSGANNVAVGWASLNGNTSASDNAAFGSEALYLNSTGFSNTAVGRFALRNNTTASRNTGVGTGAGGNNTTGSNNTAIGNDSLRLNTTGASNTVLGSEALYSNTTASNNTAVGYQAGYNNTTGAENTFGGWAAGYGVTTGFENTAYGARSGGFTNASTGSYNTALGSVALRNVTTGYSNTAIGRAAAVNTTTGHSNVAIGQNVMENNTSGSQNVAIGAGVIGAATGALGANTTGSSNVAVGFQALASNTTASNNTVVGNLAGSNTTTGAQNTFIGDRAGVSNTGGGRNVFVGHFSGNPTTGGQNTFIGTASGELITTGSKNAIIGAYNGNQFGLDIRTASNFIVLSDGDGNPRGYHNGSNWISSTGGFISKQGSRYYNNYSTTSSWGSNFNTVIPPNTLGRGQTYLIHLIWNFTSGDQPYYLDAVMLFTATNTNGTGGDNQVDLVSVTHTGDNGRYYTVRGVAGLQSTSGLQVRLTNVTNNGELFVYAVQIATGA